MYVNYPPYSPYFSQFGFLNGARNMDSQNDKAMDIWNGIGIETGMNPIIRIRDTH